MTSPAPGVTSRRMTSRESCFPRAKLDAGLIITDERLMEHVAKLTSLKRLEIADLDIQNLLRLGAAPPSVTTLAISRCPLLSLRGAEKWRQITRLFS